MPLIRMCLCYLLVHPLNELVPVYHHSLADEYGREAFASHQSVRACAGDAEDCGDVLCLNSYGKLIKRFINDRFGHIGIPFVGKNVDKLKWVLRPSGEIIQPPLM